MFASSRNLAGCGRNGMGPELQCSLTGWRHIGEVNFASYWTFSFESVELTAGLKSCSFYSLTIWMDSNDNQKISDPIKVSCKQTQ